MTAARLAIPWYVHPAEDPDAWTALAVLSPRPSFVVANIHDGPGEPADPWYPAALAQLRSMRVLGYVDVNYGDRPPADVRDDVRRWLSEHKVGGVMFDRLPATAVSTERCAEYVTDARRSGAGFVAGNPGVEPQLGHLAMLDVTCVFEGDAGAYAAFRPSPGLSRVPRSRVWHLVHGCPPAELAATTDRAGRLGAGRAFVTDRAMPHPWGGFPLGWTGAAAGGGRTP